MSSYPLCFVIDKGGHVIIFVLSKRNATTIDASHFLLSAKARTLSLVQVARLSDDQAHATFRALRWHETGGEPVCPACGCVAVYEYRTRRLFKCQGCGKQFTVTSGTTFHGRKLPMRDYLMAIAIFANAAKGLSALQLGRDLDVSYKTAFVLAHKLREAMGADQAKYQPQGPCRDRRLPTSAAPSSRRTTRPTGWTVVWPSTRPASAASWS